MKKPPFTHTLWWTSPETPFNPDSTGYMAHTAPETPMQNHGWVKIGRAEITYEIFDQIDPLKDQLEAIETKIEAIQTEAGMKIDHLRQMKANLLALPAPTSKPTEPDDDLPF